MRHFASSRFWLCYHRLPDEVRAQADKQFELLKANPSHPSLHFKKVGPYWSARVNLQIRVLAAEDEKDFVWFWIGEHQEYERFIKRR